MDQKRLGRTLTLTRDTPNAIHTFCPITHKAGCRNIKQDVRNSDCGNYYSSEYASKYEAWADYNEDFIAESLALGDKADANTYSITWEPCTTALPAT